MLIVIPFYLQQQLMRMEEESKLKSQQIEVSNASIHHLSEEIAALSNSLLEKKATVAHLWSQLQIYQKAPEQLLDSLPQTIQIVQRLEHRLQEAEYQKQQAELEREATVQEVEVLQNFELRLHAELGKLCKNLGQLQEQVEKADMVGHGHGRGHGHGLGRGQEPKFHFQPFAVAKVACLAY